MTLTKEQLEHFKEEGYVVLEAALQDADFEPVIQDYERSYRYSSPRICTLMVESANCTRMNRLKHVSPGYATKMRQPILNRTPFWMWVISEGKGHSILCGINDYSI